MEGKVTDFKTVSKLTRLDLIWFDSCPDFGAHQGEGRLATGSPAWREGSEQQLASLTDETEVGDLAVTVNRKPVEAAGSLQYLLTLERCDFI